MSQQNSNGETQQYRQLVFLIWNKEAQHLTNELKDLGHMIWSVGLLSS